MSSVHFGAAGIDMAFPPVKEIIIARFGFRGPRREWGLPRVRQARSVQAQSVQARVGSGSPGQATLISTSSISNVRSLPASGWLASSVTVSSVRRRRHRDRSGRGRLHLQLGAQVDADVVRDRGERGTVLSGGGILDRAVGSSQAMSRLGVAHARPGSAASSPRMICPDPTVNSSGSRPRDESKVSPLSGSGVMDVHGLGPP